MDKAILTHLSAFNLIEIMNTVNNFDKSCCRSRYHKFSTQMNRANIPQQFTVIIIGTET